MDSSRPIVISTETVNESHYSAEFKNNINITSTDANNLVRQIRYIKNGRLPKKSLPVNTLTQSGGSRYYKFTKNVPCHLSMNENTLDGHIVGLDIDNNAIINTNNSTHFIKLDNNLQINNNNMYGGTALSITSEQDTTSTQSSSNKSSSNKSSSKLASSNKSSSKLASSNKSSSNNDSFHNKANIFRNSNKSSTQRSSSVNTNVSSVQSLANSSIHTPVTSIHTPVTSIHTPVTSIHTPVSSTNRSNSSNIFKNSDATSNKSTSYFMNSSQQTEIYNNTSFNSSMTDIESSNKSIHGMRGGNNVSNSMKTKTRAGFLNMDSNSVNSYFSESSSSPADSGLCD